MNPTFAYYVLPVLVIALFALVVYIAFHKIGRWLCDRVGSHAAPDDAEGDTVGRCPRCGRYVMRDSTGHWFDVRP